MDMMSYPLRPLILALALVSLWGCASMPEENQTMPSNPEVQAKLLDSAQGLLGKKAVVVRGRKFAYDCSGLVCGIYYGAGIDLQASFGRYSGNGVRRIHSMLHDEGLLYTTKRPAPGDVVFWDNTYDENGDGKWNDELTHVGMVTAVDDSGTIDYIHLNYRTGIVIEQMNLYDPGTTLRKEFGHSQRFNSRMRMMGQPAGPGETSGELFRDFGAAYLLKR